MHLCSRGASVTGKAGVTGKARVAGGADVGGTDVTGQMWGSLCVHHTI